MSKNIHPDILKRRSIISFSDREIPGADLELLFEAARWAPSSRNAQPWRFIYARKNMKDAYRLLFNLLYEQNQAWAGTAPVLALSVAETVSSYKNRPNYYAFHDLGMAMGNLLVQATSMDIFVHQMGGFDKERAKQDLEIPAGYEPGAMIALGYKGNIKDMPEELWPRELDERTRKNIDEFVFTGKWGHSAESR